MKEGSGSGRGRIALVGRNTILVITSVLILLLAIACSPAGRERSEETTVRTGGKTSQIETAKTSEQARTNKTSRASGSADTSEALEKLKVAQPGSMSGYSREKFSHWSKASEFGWDPPQASCDAREAALIRDGKNVKAGKDCKITSGEWYDPYTDQTYSDPKDLDIDHVVPLANAWRSGASSWNDHERERYANDPDVLLSVRQRQPGKRRQGARGLEAPQQERMVRLRRAVGKYQGQVRLERKRARKTGLRADA